MSGEDECEEWVGWVDYKPGRIIRMTGRIVRVGRPCAVCGHVVPERDEHPYSDHAEDCALAIEWRVEALARAHEPTTGAKTPLRREEVRALLDEGRRIATDMRKAREARERDPERCR